VQSGPYRAMVNQLAQQNERRLIIDIAMLRKFDNTLAHRLLRFPTKYVPAFHSALQEFVARVVILDPEQRKQQQQQRTDEWFIGLRGNFGAYQLSPRSLSAVYLRSLVCVEGIATKCTAIIHRQPHYQSSHKPN
jgi:DNA replication licensing factor MCM3